MSLSEVSPIIFEINIFGINFALRWYAIAYVLGIIIAWALLISISKKHKIWKLEKSPIETNIIENFITYIILGVIFGGRLGYVLFYQPNFYINNPLEIFQIWKGGMSFHGGLIGVGIGIIIFSFKNNISIISLSDFSALATPPGIFLGRVSNFINGELWGKPTNSIFGVIFPSAEAQKCPIDWTFAVCTRHPSQLYEAFLEGIFLWIIMLIIVFFFKGLNIKGLLLAIFILGYGVSRFIVEYFRNPDIQFISQTNPNGYILYFNENFGFSMGQLLSTPMILIGLVILFWSISNIKKTKNEYS